jgi:hypothetical protein
MAEDHGHRPVATASGGPIEVKDGVHDVAERVFRDPASSLISGRIGSMISH